MKFVLNGCDINFLAEAPEDITLKQLLKQLNQIGVRVESARSRRQDGNMTRM